MAKAILFTQCLQNDFVKPIGRHESLPNQLHIGYHEALRLIGENPSEGPVARLMGWAYQRDAEDLDIIHIRDWHDPDDPAQQPHLEQFGPHCLQNTAGARFAFPEPAGERRGVATIDSLSLNDFQTEELKPLLSRYRGQPVKIGITGVWTEAKVAYLAYELTTRFPEFQVGICSALVASSSRSQHFIALDQMERLLGVKIFASVGEFINFLGFDGSELSLHCLEDERGTISIDGADGLCEADSSLVRFLFRDSRSVALSNLTGGFSGNVVMGCVSKDAFGHEQAPHVIKIGDQELIGRERSAFERIESVLGNNAPRITDFADLKGRGAIKYRYASMGGGFSSTFQKLYEDGLPMAKVRTLLEEVFVEQLGRFYAAASQEKVNLLEYYCYDSKWAPSVRRKVEELLRKPADGKFLQFDNGTEFPNVCEFYEQELDRLPKNRADSNYFSYIHGDLNGANIIVDNHENVWLIDFFHTHRGHVLKDLIKLENDVLYIFTKLANEADFEEALSFTRMLMTVMDLAAPLPAWDGYETASEKFRRAYDTVAYLRSLYPPLVGTDRGALQLHIGQMRYAVHTLGFEESNDWQRKWALYTAALCGRRIVEQIETMGPLRVEWLQEEFTAPGKIGLTILPGRRDRGRDLETDIASLKREKITHVVSLLTDEELRDYGVSGLIRAYQEHGFRHYRLSILDQKVCSPADMRALIAWIEAAVADGARVMIHCVGGIGRSGTAAACFLRTRGIGAEDAITEVRRARSPRAIETPLQEEFVAAYGD